MTFSSRFSEVSKEKLELLLDNSISFIVISLRLAPVFASSSRWFIVLFTFVVIGHCDCFGVFYDIQLETVLLLSDYSKYDIGLYA